MYGGRRSGEIKQCLLDVWRIMKVLLFTVQLISGTYYFVVKLLSLH